MNNKRWWYEVAHIHFQDLHHIDATIYMSMTQNGKVVLRKRINKILEVKDKFLLKQLFLYKNNLDEKVNFVYSLSNYYSTEKVENSNIVRVTKYSYKKVSHYNINYKLVLVTAMITSPKRIDLENLNIEFKFEESFWEGETSSGVSTKIWEKDFPIERVEEYSHYKECFTTVNGLELSCKYDFVDTESVYDHELGVPQGGYAEDAGIYGWDLS
jgi:hypothetical protein